MPIDLSGVGGVDLRPSCNCATIMLAGAGRDRLTMQALRSYAAHTDGLYNRLFVVVEDDKQRELVRRMCVAVMPGPIVSSTAFLSVPSAKGNLGALRNWGVMDALRYANPTYLHFVDNDVCFLPHYLQALIAATEFVEIVGGCRHPYHDGRYAGCFNTPVDYRTIGEKDDLNSARCTQRRYSITMVDAVAGYSMFIPAITFAQLGEFVASGKGIGASEDWEYCQRAKSRGKRVAYVEPPVLLHCGLTNSNGERCTGAVEIERQLDNFSKEHPEVGLIYE